MFNDSEQSNRINFFNEKLVEEKLKLQSSLKSGANWFYWITGLSLINTAIFMFGGDWSFVIGLSLTMFVDAFVLGVSQALSADYSLILQVISIVIDLIIAGIFALFGYFANKRHNWSFIVGMVFYALDGLISLVIGDYLSLAFHGFALYGIFGGLNANKKLAEMGQKVSEQVYLREYPNQEVM